MADNHLDRNLNHQLTAPYAYEFDRLLGVVNSQTFGHGKVLGQGVYEHGWAVTAGSGLTANIAAGCGIIDSSNGFVFVETASATSVDATDGIDDDTDNNFVYVELVEETVYWDPDSRDDATPTFTVYDSAGDRLGAQILAQVKTAAGVITEVVDLRVDLMLSDHDDRLDVIEAWQNDVEGHIGSDYFDGSPPSNIDSRLDALEAGGGGGGGGTVYWDPLTKAVGDPTTIQQAIDAGDATTLAAAQAGQAAEFESENWDEDAVNTLETIVRLAHIAPEIAATSLGVNDRYRTIILVPGIVGHLAVGDANGIIDEANSDMDIVDFTNHRFG